MDTPDSLVTQVGDRLASVAPYLIGDQRRFEHAPVPVFIWAPGQITFAGDESGKNPTTFGVANITFDVYIRAQSFADVFGMIACLKTALMEKLSGYHEFGDALPVDDRTTFDSWEYQQKVILRVPIAQVVIPDEAGTDPSDVEEDVDGEAEIDDVEIDASGAAAGDGELWSGEA